MEFIVFASMTNFLNWERQIALAYNILRLGVCYFALQTFQALDEFNRQNNRHQAAVSGWCGKLTENVK